uniref:Uncharacterized protein n=1 Tax=Electrophorus electricus TaxID=8005 RepID=A0AAY5EUR7_ELEEL
MWARHPVYGSARGSSPTLHTLNFRTDNKQTRARRRKSAYQPSKTGTPTFDNITVNSCSELFFRPLIEVLAVYDAHLFEESGLAALSSAEQDCSASPLLSKHFGKQTDRKDRDGRKSAIFETTSSIR